MLNSCHGGRVSRRVLWLSAIAGVLFLVWAIVVLVAPFGVRSLHGKDVPLGFVGQLERSSPFALTYLDQRFLEINEELTELRRFALPTSVKVGELIRGTRGSKTILMERQKSCVVCRYGEFIFVVTEGDRISAILRIGELAPLAQQALIDDACQPAK